MNADYRSPMSDINVVYLTSYLGMGEPAGHRCDCKCIVERVLANLYVCKSSNVTHVCDKNCNQRIIYDNHTSVCRMSRRFCPLTASEQEAIRGVRRKREPESYESCATYKRRHELTPRSSAFESPYNMGLQASGRFNSGESAMDLN